MLNPNKVKLGIAPIGWSNDDMPELGKENTFQQCISEMALAGFTGSEIGRKYPSDPAELKPYLDIRGLTICNAWFSSKLTSDPYEQTIQNFIAHRDKLHALGAKVIGASEQGGSIQGKTDVPIFGLEKPVYTEDQWQTVFKGFNEMGRLAREKDMFFTVHHHMGTGIQTLDEIDKLMDNTDPQLVYLLFDTGHAVFAGEDAVALLKKYDKRVKHVHLKDIRMDVFEQVKAQSMSFLQAVRAGVFTVPGDGDFDFEPVFDVLNAADYEGWVVVEAEQDPAKANPFEYALKGRAYIREKTGL